MFPERGSRWTSHFGEQTLPSWRESLVGICPHGRLRKRLSKGRPNAPRLLRLPANAVTDHMARTLTAEGSRGEC